MRSSNAKSTEVSLAEAALRLRLSYGQALRLLTNGTLTGDRRHGHWYVDKRSLAKAARTAA